MLGIHNVSKSTVQGMKYTVPEAGIIQPDYMTEGEGKISGKYKN